ncbi:clan AA aspartic protease [Armatimonas sp.]|uniref:clan AA aspartic protease n=1 Tax=Armatimonas sp. TaxID=1872638 RepID=UPI0037506B32
MMQGTVTKYQARLTVPFLLVGKPNLGIEFVVDTGFAGELTLPASAVAALGLPFLTELTANLADDSGVPVKVHIATILWHGQECEVAVLAMGKRPLLGTALLAECDLTVEFTDSGSVVIKPRL